MVYCLYGQEYALIREYIDSLIEEEKIDNVINYNLEDVSLNDIIEDASYDSLFGDKKIIIVNNSYFLKSEMDINILEDYVKNMNNNTHLLFVLNEENIDSRKKIVKLLKEKGIVKEFNTLNELSLKDRIRNKIKKDKYEIDDKGLNELILRCKNDYSLIMSEIDKLELLRLNDKNISYNDVVNVVSRNIEDDVFRLTDAIAEKNKVKVLRVYKDLLESGVEPVTLIGVIASQMRTYKQVSDLISINYSGDIDKKLGIHPFRVKLAREKLTYFSAKDIEDILTKLANLDYEIKSGKIDKNIGLELLLFEL